jgi:protocatechuate 3,4-dioxygenase beta subunit
VSSHLVGDVAVGDPVTGGSDVLIELITRSGDVIDSQKTTVTGAFDFADVTDGEYSFHFACAQSCEKEYWQDSSSLQEATFFVVNSNNPVPPFTVTLAAAAATVPTPGLMRMLAEPVPSALSLETGSISGTVRDSAGNPIEGVDVWVFSRQVPDHQASAVTLSDGSYTVFGLASDTYLVDFSKGNSPYIKQYLGGVSSFEGATEVTVGSRNGSVGNDAILVTGATISGFVTDPYGQPVEGVDVGIWYEGGGSGGGARTDSGGFFQWAGAPAGSFKLNYSKWDSPYVTAFSGGTTSSSAATIFEVVLGQVFTQGDFQMIQGASISGVVRDAEGNPVEGVQVSAARPSDGGFSDNSAADGSYEIRHVDAGSYTLQFSKFPFGSVFWGGASSESGATVLTIALGDVLTEMNVFLPAGASISGVVRDSAGNPIQGVKVSASESPCCSGSSSAATTSADGSYTVQGLSAGNFTVYFSKNESSYVSQYLGGSTSSFGATVLSVSAGDALTGKDATLATGASISGVVRDSGGNPIEGVSISVNSSPCCSGGSGYAYSASDGSYKVEGLPAGTYSVQFFKQGSPFISQYLGASTSSPQGSLTVEAGAVLTGKDVTLIAGASIAGTVRDAAGNPIEGVSVNANSSPVSCSYCYTTTLADGSYQINGLPAASYRVQFSKYQSSYVSQYFGGTASYSAATLISVAAGSVLLGKDATLPLGGSISGVVRDSAGQPISGVSVTPSSSSGSSSSSVSTASDGSYKVDGLGAGSYTVRFDKYQSSFVGQYLGGSGSFVGATVLTVTAGVALVGKDITLPTGASISGVVRDSSGNPIEGVNIWASSSDGSGYGSGNSSSDGTYKIDGLPSGEYKIHFNKYQSPYVSQYFGGVADSDSASPLRVALGEALTGKNVVLPIGARISGTVRDTSGQSLAGVTVSANAGIFSQSSTQTGSDGTYALQGLEAGSYLVDFRPPSGSTAAAEYWNNKTLATADPIVVALGDIAAGKDVVLATGASIAGVATDAQGNALTGVLVTAFGTLATVTATSGSDGSYVLPGLPTGAYKLSFEAGTSGKNLATQWWSNRISRSTANTLSVTEGQVMTGKNVTMAVGATVSGTIRDSAGNPLSGAHIELFPVAETPFEWPADTFYSRLRADTAGDGTFSITGLTQGSFTLRADRAGAYPVEISSSGQIVTKNIQLGGGGSISGTVYDAIDPALKVFGIQVSAYLADRTFLGSTTTNASGRYALTDLPVGRIFLEFVGSSSGGSRCGGGAGGGSGYSALWSGNATSLATATGITSSPGSVVTGVDASLTVGGSITGKVTDSSGKALAGMMVALWDVTSGRAVQMGLIFSTESDGTYSFVNLTPGSYRVLASEGGEAFCDTPALDGAGVGRYQESFYGGSSLASARDVVVTEEGITSGISIAMTPTASLKTLTTATPTVSGSPVVGQTLSATAGSWTSGTVFAYAWKRNGNPILGANSSSYKVAPADLDASLSVTVTGSLAGYSTVYKDSAATSRITSSTVGAFTTVGVPTIVGVPEVGLKLTASTGVWAPVPTFTYRWLRDGVTIAGATASRYLLSASDVASRISVEITGVKTGYGTEASLSTTTAAVANGVFVTTPVPTVSGSAIVGQTLSAASGSWAPATGSLTYAWKRSGVTVSGATGSTFLLSAADVGSRMTVVVTGARAGYSSVSQTSVETSAVSGRSFLASPVPTISGTTTFGSRLSVSAGTWSPVADSFTYVWKRGGAVISGAASSTYDLQVADVGSKISVVVTGVKDGYTSVSQTSLESAAVTPLSFETTPLPTVSGVTTVGQTLMAATGSWSPVADSFTYLWKRAGVPILGATASTYDLQALDGGAVLSVTVTGIKSGYTSVSQTSAETTAIVRTFTSMPTPVLSGVTTVGQRLTALPGTWLPSPTLTYVWKRDGVVISGQASSGYRLVAADAGKQITVEVTGTRAGYVSATQGSTPTQAVTGLPFATTPVPMIMGEATVGQTVSAVAGTWSPLAESYTYVWKRGGVPISGATAQSYELQLADAGTVISVSVTAVKQGYMPAPQTSANTAAVLRAFASPPTPTIAGVATVGQRLQSTTGTWSPSPTFTYVWKRDGAVIVGQASSGYRLVAADAGKRISVEVYGSRAGYATTGRTSVTTDVVASLPFVSTPVPTIAGTTTVGLTLTAVPGVWSPAVDSYSYVWKRGGTIISGASASAYKLVSADLGNTITVEVTGVKLGYVASTQTSVATAVVSAPAFTLAPTPTIVGTPIVGQRLTASVGTWSPAPTFTYVWRRGGVVIVGAVSSGYRLLSADVGKLITVEVTGTRAGYLTAMRASLATAGVTR